MSSRNLERWALVAEIIGGVAIVVSLGIVAFELDQGNEQAAHNTSALEIASYQDLMANITTLNDMVIANPLQLSAVGKSMNDPESLSVEERTVAYIYYMSVFRHGDMAYFQFERGAIDLPRLESALFIVTERLRVPFVHEFWESQKQLFVPEYREFIDSTLATERKTDLDF